MGMIQDQRGCARKGVSFPNPLFNSLEQAVAFETKRLQSFSK